MSEGHENCRTIVLRLIEGELEGAWMEVDNVDIWSPATNVDGRTVPPVRMVPTGDVEWNSDDDSAEVYVPADRLEEWKSPLVPNDPDLAARIEGIAARINAHQERGRRCPPPPQPT